MSGYRRAAILAASADGAWSDRQSGSLSRSAIERVSRLRITSRRQPALITGVVDQSPGARGVEEFAGACTPSSGGAFESAFGAAVATGNESATDDRLRHGDCAAVEVLFCDP